MANLTPTAGWDNVPQLETTTLAQGGPGGVMNSQAQALLNRTEQLNTAKASTTAVSDGDASTLASAKTYADGKASAAVTSANGYTDSTATTTLASAKTYADGVGTSALTSANSYTDTKTAATLASAKTYADSIGTSTLTAAEAYADAAAASVAAKAPLTLASIAALRANTNTTVEAVYVTSYYTNSGSGGGNYRRDTTDTTSTDNGGTIIVDAAGARWKLQAKFGVTYYDFGAKGDGSDDTAFIQKAFDWGASTGQPILTGAGSFHLTAQITASTTTNQLIVHGAGHASSQMVWDSGSPAGIAITYSDSIRPPIISNVGLIAGFAGASAALYITAPNSVSEIQMGPTVDNVRVQGGDMGTHYWTKNIVFKNCWYPRINGVNINGRNEYGPTFASAAGIELIDCQACYFHDFNIFHVTDGVLQTYNSGNAHGEGFNFHTFEIVGVANGFNLSAGINAPGTNIGPGHVNAFNCPVKLYNRFQMSIHDLLLYKTDDLTGTPQDWIGIHATDCRLISISNNKFFGFKAASLVGIQIDGSTVSDYNQVHDNYMYDFSQSAGGKVGIVVGTGVGDSDFYNNHMDSTISNPWVVSGADLTNRFYNNWPAQTQTLAQNSATPSVANALGKSFMTANTVSTTITNLLNGYDQQEVTIVCNDAALTKIQHNGTSIYLSGATTFNMAAGSTITLRLFGTLWREISRTA